MQGVFDRFHDGQLTWYLSLCLGIIGFAPFGAKHGFYVGVWGVVRSLPKWCSGANRCSLFISTGPGEGLGVPNADIFSKSKSH